MWKDALRSIFGSRVARTREARLLRGSLRANSGHPSLLFLTVHKAASTYVGELLGRIAKSERIIPIDLANLCYGYDTHVVDTYLSPELRKGITGKPFVWSEDIERELTRAMRPQGFMYGAFRTASFLSRLPQFDQFKVLVQLRDPRDVLTSLYYSIAFSHDIPGNNPKLSQHMLKRRNEARGDSIDDFVIKYAPVFVQRYRAYCQEFLPRRNVRLVKYEDMVTDFPRWLEEVLHHWGLSSGTKTASKLIEQADFEVREERHDSHKRQVKPGDHLRKLKPRTIDLLNAKFSDVLFPLDYLSQPRQYAAAA
jgi:hypothetical protein